MPVAKDWGTCFNNFMGTLGPQFLSDAESRYATIELELLAVT